MEEKLYYHGKVYCGSGRYAEAFWVRDGRFRSVGTDAALLAAVPADCPRLDLGGATVLPGLNDSHMHLLEIGLDLDTVDLYAASSVGVLLNRCRAFIARRQPAQGAAVVGNGWNEDKFDHPAIPTRTKLDTAAPDRPLVLNRVCGHMLTCNTAALCAAGITENTPVPAGGGIDLGPDGTPNGILRDNAMALLDPLLPGKTAARCEEAYLAAMARAAACGITSVQTNDPHADTWPAVLAALQSLERKDLLTVRINLQCAFETPAQLQSFFDAGWRPGKGGRRWQVGSLKLFTDGSLGARTARLRQDYADAPGERGLLCMDKPTALAMVRLANGHGMPAVAHAIGDAAIEQMLDVYREVGPAGNPLRNGIIHCQITTPDQWRRFASERVAAYVQPIFLNYDHTIAAARVGEALAATSYAFSTPAAYGARISYGTDAPVEDCNPFANLYCAVTRKGLDGAPAGGWHPEERLGRGSAVDHYTIESAWAEHAENIKGRIAPGYLADFAVLDRDYFTVPEAEIPGIQITRTAVGGREVFVR